MKTNTKRLLICIAIPLLIGGLAALLSRTGMQSFDNLNKPALTPPGFLFPIVWTILYSLMGYASYLIWNSNQSANEKKSALITYGIQLGINFFWPILFFQFKLYLVAFFWLLLLLSYIIVTIILFLQISKKSAYLLAPYVVWVTFAGYLNLSTYLLNR